MRQKYPLHNEEIQTSGVVKLLDDSGRVIGVYTAAEARKKAEGSALDMVLVNRSKMPIICKLTDFRRKTLSRFYDEVVSQKEKESTFFVS